MARNETERVSVRHFKSTVEKIDRLVDAGLYPNRSEVIRTGVDAVLSLYDFSQQPPIRLAEPREVERPTVSSRERDPDHRAAATRLLLDMWDTAHPDDDGQQQVIIYDEAGVTNGLPKPPNTTVVTNRQEFRRAVSRL